MKSAIVLTVFIAYAFALTNIGTLTEITSSGSYQGSLPPTPSTQAEYPIDYTIRIPLNAKNVAVTVTADGDCSVNHNFRFHGLTCDQTEVTPYYLCSPTSYDHETSQTYNYPIDATIFRTNANMYLGVYRLVAGDEPCPYTITVSYAYCAAGQVVLPGFNSVSCFPYVNATFGNFYTVSSNASDVLYRYVVPENTGSLVFHVASDYDLKFMGNPLAPINDQTVNNDLYTCVKTIGFNSEATFQCDVPNAGDFWFNIIGGGVNHNTNFTITALQCSSTTAGRNCSYPLMNLATLTGTYTGTVDPKLDDGYYPFAYFYLDSNPGDAKGYAITFKAVGNTEIWTRKGAAPIYIPNCYACSLYWNWINIDSGTYYITPWDTWDGQRIYFGVSTDDLSPGSFSISIKPQTFPELSNDTTTTTGTGFAIAPQVALIVLFLALLF